MIGESSGVDDVEVSGCLGADVLSRVETENQWVSGWQSPLKLTIEQKTKACLTQSYKIVLFSNFISHVDSKSLAYCI